MTPPNRPETCRHCGTTREEGHYRSGLAFCCKVGARHHGFEPGPTYEQLEAELSALREATREQEARLVEAEREYIAGEALRALVRELCDANDALPKTPEWGSVSEHRAKVRRLEKAFEKARSALGDTPPVRNDGWIPVTERVPGSERELVVACGWLLSPVIARFWPGSGDWAWELNGDTLSNVTHWMPLPKPPRTGDT